MTMIFVFFALAFIIIFAVQRRAQLLQCISTIDQVELQIDTKLDHRYETFVNLIEIMNQYMDIEKTTFREVIELKQKAMEARDEGDEKARVSDEDKISRDVEGISYAFEQHDDLKNNAKANELFEKLVSEEGDLAELKQACNKEIELFDHHRNSLFGSMVVFAFSSELNQNYEKWRVNSDALEGRDKYQVEM